MVVRSTAADVAYKSPVPRVQCRYGDVGDTPSTVKAAQSAAASGFETAVAHSITGEARRTEDNR
jgi:hypothetical protein